MLCLSLCTQETKRLIQTAERKILRKPAAEWQGKPCTPFSASSYTSSVIQKIFIATLLLSLACSADDTPELAASWQDIQVTLTDFERNYFNYWQTSRLADSQAVRKAFARRMIEQEIIARQHKTSADYDPGIYQKRLDRDHALFSRRRYLEGEIKDALPEITARELSQAAERQRIRLRVRQLFAREKTGIEKLAKRLEAGEAFEAIARDATPDSLIAANGGDLGWIGWGDTDLPVEDVIYSLKRGEISPPVQSLMGWHVFRVDSIQREVAFAELHPLEKIDLRKKLQSREFDLAAAEHLRKLVWQKELVVDMRVMPELWNYLEQNLPLTAREALLSNRPKPQEKPAESLNSRTIATVDGQAFLVADFLDAVPDLPRHLLRPNLKKAVEVAVRDKIVTEEAHRLNYDEDPVVQEKLRRASIGYAYYAALAVRGSADAAKITPEGFYKKHRRRYVDFTETEVFEILVAGREEALRLAKQIHEGMSFSEAAKRFSQRDSTKNRGGILGWVRSDDGKIGERAAKLDSGQIYAPIETATGFSIIKTGARRIVYKDFESAQKQVIIDMEREKISTLHQALLPDNYDPQQIIYFDANLKKAMKLDRKTVF